jgi:hypothetical protein
MFMESETGPITQKLTPKGSRNTYNSNEEKILNILHVSFRSKLGSIRLLFKLSNSTIGAFVTVLYFIFHI